MRVSILTFAQYTLLVNIGIGKDSAIRELAGLIAEVVDYRGDIVFDQTRQDGTPRKLLDVSRLNELGWQASTELKAGLRKAYQDYCRLNDTGG